MMFKFKIFLFILPVLICSVEGSWDISSLFSANRIDSRQTEKGNGLEDLFSHFNSSVSTSVAKNVFDLSKRLTEKILETSTKKFEVLSPISISAAIHLAFLGANRRTYDELNTLLGYDGLHVESHRIHKELSEIIEDLVSDIPNANRPRKDCTWKRDFEEMFASRMQKYHPDEIHHEIYVANGIFVQKDFSIRPTYKAAVESVYKSELKKLDFKREGQATAKYINDWVDEKTKGKITEIFKAPCHPDTKVLLVNALYFKALWMTPFTEGECCTRKFYPDGVDGRSYDVKYMPHGGHFPYYKDTECAVQVLGFPYQKGISTMYVFFPDNSSKAKLKSLQKCLTADKVEEIIEKMKDAMAVVLFPRLHLQSSYSLRSKLKELGLNSLFENGISDLSLMSDSGESHNPNRPRGLDRDNSDDKFYFAARADLNDDPLVELDQLRRNSRNLRNPGIFADEVIHKVDLTINEKGTEGGSATAISMQRTTKVVFRVDGPFMILIRHDPTKIPLFYGAVFEPVDDTN